MKVLVANLGSIDMDAPFHHLYEWGNIPLFCAVGRASDGKLVAYSALRDGWFNLFVQQRGGSVRQAARLTQHAANDSYPSFSPDGNFVAFAAQTGVTHASPQALWFRDGRVAWHASHGEITGASLAAAVGVPAVGVAFGAHDHESFAAFDPVFVAHSTGVSVRATTPDSTMDIAIVRPNWR